MADSLHPRSSHRRLLVAMVVIVAILALLVPGAVLASHQYTAMTIVPPSIPTFIDVPDTNTFHDDIGWLGSVGVTKGCNPPTNDMFCPDGNVSRGQMAAFMHRFAEFLGAEYGVVSEAYHATRADRATTADNADTLQGYQAAELTTDAWGTSLDSAKIEISCEVMPGYGPCSDGPEFVASLIGIPAGSYVVIAKAHQAYLGGDGGAESLCELAAEDTVDQTYNTVRNTSYHPTSFMLLHTFEEDGGIVELRCTHWGGSYRGMMINDIKITAISVGTLTEWPLDAEI